MPVDLSDVPFAFYRGAPPVAGPPVVRLDAPGPVRTIEAEKFLSATPPTESTTPPASATVSFFESQPGCTAFRSGRHIRRDRVRSANGRSQCIDGPGLRALHLGASEEHHMRIYARRIEFNWCRSVGDWYACFASDVMPREGTGRLMWFKMEDLLFYGCDFLVNEDRSVCVRLHVKRLVIKCSTVASGGRHGLRLIGNSSYLFIRNLRCGDSNGSGNGIHIGTLGDGRDPADQANISRVWLRDVTSRYTSGDVDIARDGSVRFLIADNVWAFQSNGFSSWETITTEPLPAGWRITYSGLDPVALPLP